MCVNDTCPEAAMLLNSHTVLSTGDVHQPIPGSSAHRVCRYIIIYYIISVHTCAPLFLKRRHIMLFHILEHLYNVVMSYVQAKPLHSCPTWATGVLPWPVKMQKYSVGVQNWHDTEKNSKICIKCLFKKLPKWTKVDTTCMPLLLFLLVLILRQVFSILKLYSV